MNAISPMACYIYGLAKLKANSLELSAKNEFTTIGLNVIARGLADGVNEPVNSMSIFWHAGEHFAATSNKIELNSIAVFEGSFAPENYRRTVSALKLWRNNNLYSSISADFVLPIDVSLEVEWRATIVASNWTNLGREKMANCITSSATRIDGMNKIHTDATSETEVIDGSVESTTICVWKATFDVTGKTVDLFQLTSGGYDMASIDVTDFLLPADTDLVVTWRTTISAG